jgi:tyrosine decarboxylase/aspartate 1-decarboxylase
MLCHLETETPYLTTSKQYTFVGTRSGASAASAWAVINTLGIEGYRKVVVSCINNTKTLAKNLKKVGFKLLCEPTLNILAIQTKNPQELTKKLSQQGWYVSAIPRYSSIRVIVMPHVKRRHIKAFQKVLLETEKL